MNDLIAPVTRITLRYFAGFLVTIGAVDAAMLEAIAVDPTLTMIVGGGLALATEAIYIQARKYGGAT